jgi:cyanoexosortase A
MIKVFNHIPASLKAKIPAIPPATPRNLWLLLAALVATQNLAVFQSSQDEHITVFAVLIWGGALICLEDQLESLDPHPQWPGIVVGASLLAWVIARTAVILHWDGMIFILPLISCIALALLCEPIKGIGRFRDSLLCLLMLPAFSVIMKLIPAGPMSVLTANLSGFWLGILGFDNVVRNKSVMMPTGGVEVLPACNGVDMIAQVVCIAVIFQLAFPLRSWLSRCLIFTLAPLIGLASNTIRIAILALCVANGNGKGSDLFRFFHDDIGSLVFSGIAVFVFGIIYMRLLDRELPPLPVAIQQETSHHE